MTIKLFSSGISFESALQNKTIWRNHIFARCRITLWGGGTGLDAVAFTDHAAGWFSGSRPFAANQT
jgi:hypothetical protein